MLVEETQDNLALFPIYSKNLDVSRVGYFYEKDRVLILVHVKFLFDSNRKHVVVSSQDSLRVPIVQNVCGFGPMYLILQFTGHTITLNSSLMLRLPVYGLLSCSPS
jgi:hypothetical protein